MYYRYSLPNLTKDTSQEYDVFFLIFCVERSDSNETDLYVRKQTMLTFVLTSELPKIDIPAKARENKARYSATIFRIWTRAPPGEPRERQKSRVIL